MGRYKINEIARYRDLTPNGVIYLEKVGIIQSKRDEQNGYRYYDEDDFGILAYTGLYQQVGMTLQEAGSLLNADLPEAMAQLHQTGERVRAEYERKILLQSFLTERLATTAKLLHTVEKCERPEFWLLPISPPCPSDLKRKNEWKDWEALNNNWDRMIPYTQYGQYCENAKEHAQIKRCSVVEAQVAAQLGLTDSRPVRKIPPDLCIHTVAHLDQSDAPDLLIDDLAKRFHVAARTLIMRVLHFYRKNGHPACYMEIWLPVDA